MNLSGAFFFLLSAWVARAEYSQLDWSDCGSDPAITIRNIDVTPMPVVIPGPLQLTINAQLDRRLTDTFEIELDIKRHTFLLDLPIPCLYHVGSCTYENSCAANGGLLDNMVSEDWAGIMGNIGSQISTMLSSVTSLNTTTCPPPAPVSIDIRQFTINLPAMPSIISWFAEGDYRAHVTARDKSTGQTLLCLTLGLTVHEKEELCTGFFCG